MQGHAAFVTDFSDRAATMPCDESLLLSIGRVTWAAARLQAHVRDAINAIDGVASDEPFSRGLGQVIAALERRARQTVLEPDRTALLDWVTFIGRPAKDRRNEVAHAVAFTATDGVQAIGPVGGWPVDRFHEPELLQIAGQLEDASSRLPRGPYRTTH
jgi:hypothetical protein